MYLIYSDSTIIREFPIIDNTTENKNISLTSARSQQHLAFIQLVALRDKWNEIDEFEPDWENHQVYKYCIQYRDNTIVADEYHAISRILAFKTKETRDLFLETFKDLIEIAKMLI